jgi:hypothetical protein
MRASRMWPRRMATPWRRRPAWSCGRHCHPRHPWARSGSAMRCGRCSSRSAGLTCRRSSANPRASRRIFPHPIGPRNNRSDCSGHERVVGTGQTSGRAERWSRGQMPNLPKTCTRRSSRRRRYCLDWPACRPVADKIVCGVRSRLLSRCCWQDVSCPSTVVRREPMPNWRVNDDGRDRLPMAPTCRLQRSHTRVAPAPSQRGIHAILRAAGRRSSIPG